MRIRSAWAVVLLVIAGCSLGESEARRRVGHWERYPEFRSCVKEAVPEDRKYGQEYQSCIQLEIVNEQAMRCVRDITPARELGQIEICERQLRDLVAYGAPTKGPEEPSEAWAGPVGNLLSILF
jgi:hypothetical protein